MSFGGGVTPCVECHDNEHTGWRPTTITTINGSSGTDPRKSEGMPLKAKRTSKVQTNKMHNMDEEAFADLKEAITMHSLLSGDNVASRD